ncbi:MAG: type II toxin-antitoxin system YhaV family toxin, partial [Candidatus Omnitrophica bacterium]|nr:type II toxin-antitoxin system YhaV family toxin [Candidatus Omnitrophota bacterium]
MTTKHDYLLKAHELFFQRTVALNRDIEALSKTLNREALKQHETVKLAKRVYDATLDIIPQDPNHPSYRLHDELRKYRRYKQGLARYRLFFAFSTAPKIILYLYLNDKGSLRKEGDKKDIYAVVQRYLAL